MKLRSSILLVTMSLIILFSCGSENPTGPENKKVINNPPVIVEHGDTSTTVGDTLLLYTEAQDPDGDLLSYDGFVHVTITDLKMGTIPEYEFDNLTKVLEFRPRAYDRPIRKVSFIVEDNRGGADTTTFYINVN